MKLSVRLKCIADMVTPGLTVADVGCDHAHLSVYLIENGIAPFVYAADINEGPLKRARECIERAGLSDRIRTVLCDGLTGIRAGSVGSIVIAGMGGPLMTDIMRASGEVCLGADELILEPQSEPSLVRHYLEESGYRIISEKMVCEENRFYPVLKCIHGKMELKREVFYRYGSLLITEKDPMLIRHLHNHRRVLLDIRNKLDASEETESVLSKKAELQMELQYAEEAIFMIEGVNYEVSESDRNP